MSDRTWLAILFLLATSACSDAPEHALEGRWFGEAVENVETSQLASATGWVRGASFEFAGSQITVAIPVEAPRSAPFKVVNETNSRYTVAIQRPDGAVDIAQFTKDADDEMRWHIGGSRSVLLRRFD